MPSTFAMPDVGEGLTEAEIIEWRVTVGDIVTVNQIIAEVETAKAVVELPSPYAGKVVELHYAAGDTVPVGAPIIAVAGEGEHAAATSQLTSTAPQQTPGPDSDAPQPATAKAPTREPVLVGYGVQRAEVKRRPRREGPPPLQRHATDGPYAKPPLRKLAKQLGVNLATLSPTGLRGEVTRADILAVQDTNQSQPAACTPETREPIRGVRKHIAEAMVKSAFTAPHVTEWLTVDVTRTLELLERLKTRAAGVRLTPLTLLARAVLLSTARHPEMNARWDADAKEIVRYGDVNLGIAVASPRGLIVPNIRAAQALSFSELAQALNRLVEDARANKTAPEEMQQGTFTITNVGVFGVDGATPILNPGESGIIAFGQIRERPWIHEGQLAIRAVATLSLSFDHRLIDGELGSTYLADTARLLENPDLALAW